MIRDQLPPDLQAILDEALTFMPAEDGTKPSKPRGSAMKLAVRVRKLQVPEILQFRAALRVAEMDFLGHMKYAEARTRTITDPDERTRVINSLFPLKLAEEMSAVTLILFIIDGKLPNETMKPLLKAIETL